MWRERGNEEAKVREEEEEEEEEEGKRPAVVRADHAADELSEGDPEPDGRREDRRDLRTPPSQSAVE
eukprot:2555339-Rhodomonas_salina.5